MKIKALCSECAEGVLADGEQLQSVDEMVVEVNLLDWPYISYECQKGHREHRIIGAELYELLFHQATYCIEDGYYREAIGTYNASLERYFEYVIEQISSRMVRESKDFETMWKQVANQSERQLGAYYFLWYTFFGETPEFLDRRKVELRNSVIHKGRLATKEESEEFGEYVFDYIRRSQERLHKAFGEPLGLHIMRMSRLFRLSSASVDMAMRNPPMLEHEGEMFFKAIGCDPMPSFLSMEEIESYWDCFNQEKAVGCPIEK